MESLEKRRINKKFNYFVMTKSSIQFDTTDGSFIRGHGTSIQLSSALSSVYVIWKPIYIDPDKEIL